MLQIIIIIYDTNNHLNHHLFLTFICSRFRMQRELFCVSIAVFALFPTLVAFYDDESYHYIEDVSNILN